MKRDRDARQKIKTSAARPTTSKMQDARCKMQEGKKMDAQAAIDKYSKIRCGGGLGGAAITGSYTRFVQRTACTRSGAMRRDRDAKQKSKT